MWSDIVITPVESLETIEMDKHRDNWDKNWVYELNEGTQLFLVILELKLSANTDENFRLQIWSIN